MIELNLLPEELKLSRKEKQELSSIPVVPVILIVALVLVSIHVLSLIFMGRNSLILSGLEKKSELYSPQKKELSNIKKRIKNIKSKINAIEHLTKERVVWAEIMSGINDCILPNIWLSRLSLEENWENEGVIIEGYALGTSEEGTSSVGRFIEALKEDPSFSKIFSDFELDSIRRSQIEKQEVMKFRLNALFVHKNEETK